MSVLRPRRYSENREHYCQISASDFDRTAAGTVAIGDCVLMNLNRLQGPSLWRGRSMNSRVKNAHFSLAQLRAPSLLVAAFIGAALIRPGIGFAGPASSVEGDNAIAAGSGPTVVLSYDSDSDSAEPNRIASFAYFVPLISRTPVERLTSANNTQEVGIISFQKTVHDQSFHVSCKFSMQGQGFHQTTYCPAEMIAFRLDALGGGQPLKGVLNYIKFEGAGFGRMDIRGTIRGSIETVTAINMQFDEDGRQSPVTVGLYDIKPNNGQYKFEDRTKEVIVRVNMLAFERSVTSPTVDVGVESIMNASSSEGILARIKGVIANQFLKPPRISTLGNETMLDFGFAILNQQPEFTFPAAINIIEDSTAREETPKP